jgi:hypothetical protein
MRLPPRYQLRQAAPDASTQDCDCSLPDIEWQHGNPTTTIREEVVAIDLFERSSIYSSDTAESTKR